MAQKHYKDTVRKVGRNTLSKEIDLKEHYMKPKSHQWNLVITVTTFLAAVLISLLFQKMNVGEHVTTLFVFAVFLISLITDGYVYGVSAAITSMLVINYAFTYPYYEMNFIIPSNLISAVIMVIIAILTGTLTIRIKRHEVMKVEAEKERMRANLLSVTRSKRWNWKHLRRSLLFPWMLF